MTSRNEIPGPEQNHPASTRRVAQQSSGDEGRVPDERARSDTIRSGGIVQQIWRRIQEERKRPKGGETNYSRSE